MLGLGTVFYTSLLLINAIAILNEERFLNRSTLLSLLIPVGWSTNTRSTSFDADGTDAGVKARLIHLIGAVRVLLRSRYP